ncbi:cryptochrome/photolyase family protein [Rudaeicoccus suwonensis]|nr:deoxyribodipyrimidine photo-lyase [Rudaeicoccus suwonensis]
MTATSLLWLRRDLRRRDHPALLAAREAAGDAGVAVAFVIDPQLWEHCGPVRRRWLAETLRATNETYDGRLVIRVGDPRTVIPRLAAEIGAASVHVTRETTPFGVRRDAETARMLADDDIAWVETGTPYAIGPGVVRNGSGDPYKVFTPFARAWREHGWPEPALNPRALDLLDVDSDATVAKLLDEAIAHELEDDLPEAGEAAALKRWREFLERVGDYGTDRDLPAKDGTSKLSPYLKLGVLHPRTLLADLAGLGNRRDKDGAETFETELAWREFYADVLHHQPDSAWHDLRGSLGRMAYDRPDDTVDAWRSGMTGFPIVDAGMRQLLQTGWMHNRVRMITASFLTKDLHIWWPIGARHFLDHLIDGDVASNNHGWQWVAGTGTDASPYFRVFNPVTQGLKFDPSGDYVRRWVPELAHLAGKAAHEPWKHADGYAHDYPEPVVDHADERREALSRYEAATR